MHPIKNDIFHAVIVPREGGPFYDQITTCKDPRTFLELLSKAKFNQGSWWRHPAINGEIQGDDIQAKLVQLFKDFNASTEDEESQVRDAHKLQRKLLNVRKWNFFKSCTPDSWEDKFLLLDNPNKTLQKTVGVYIATNESNTSSIAQQLLSCAPQEPSCHIGFSGWHNFDIMSLRKSQYGIICDFNESSSLFLNATLKKLKKSATRQIFAEKINQFIERKSTDYWSYYVPKDKILFSFNITYDPLLKPKEEVLKELEREGSWLSQDESYTYVKSLAEKDAVSVLTLDIRNTKNFEIMALAIKKSAAQVDTLYLSNINSYMETIEDRAAFRKTAFTLIEPKTLVINCPNINYTQGTGFPIQKICLGEELELPDESFALTNK